MSYLGERLSTIGTFGFVLCALLDAVEVKRVVATQQAHVLSLTYTFQAYSAAQGAHPKR